MNAKNWLQEHGYEYTEIALDNPEKRAQFKKDNPDMRTVPQIFADGEHIGGYTDLIKSRLA